MFRDVSGWEIWVTMKWHAPPKWPRWTCDTSYKCLETHFIENPRLKVVWFQDVSRCFGVGNLGHYEMTCATKMTPVNLWYKLQMLGNPFHREPEAESGLVSGCFEMFRGGKSGSLWNDTRHQNDPGEPVIQATNVWKFHRDTPGRFAGNRIHPVFTIYASRTSTRQRAKVIQAWKLDATEVTQRSKRGTLQRAGNNENEKCHIYSGHIEKPDCVR